MYRVAFVNEYGQTYSNHGLLQHYKKDFSIRDFYDLERARKHSKAFIRRYPQAVAEIYDEGEIVETHQDEEYWKWKDGFGAEWAETNKKTSKVSNIIGLSLTTVVVLCLTLIVHILGVYGFSLLYKMLITPILAAVLWHICNLIFARYF